MVKLSIIKDCRIRETEERDGFVDRHTDWCFWCGNPVHLHSEHGGGKGEERATLMCVYPFRNMAWKTVAINTTISKGP